MPRRQPRKARVPFPIFLVIGLIWVPIALRAQTTTEYYGMYLGGRKIGWTKLTTENITEEGQRRVRLTSEGSVTVEMMGTRVKQDSLIVSTCDESLRPLTQQYRITSNASEMVIRAEYRERTVEVEVRAGGAPSKRTLTIPADGQLIADSSFLGQGAEPKVGAKSVVYYLNPLTVSLEKAELIVEARESVTYAGNNHEAFRIVAKTPLGTIRSWEDPPGRILWADLPLNMTMCRLTAEEALKSDTPIPARSVSSSPTGANLSLPEDFAVATSVAPDRPIPEPRKLRSLTLKLTGMPQELKPISDERQKVEAIAGEPGAYRYEIRVPASPRGAVALPVRTPAMARYLSRDAYVETNHPEIRRIAEQLRDRRSAARTASRIRAWVHSQMKPDYSIGVLRSASDILRRRRGVCRDYTILFAAIARAAGVPTRLVGGLVYADGRFYYHAWVECWTGRWVAYDATLPQDFVDATHVKLSQGDAHDMMRVYQAIGKLSVRIISFEN